MKLLLQTIILCFCVHQSWTQTRSMTPTTNTSDKRLALIIGNSAYKGKPLPNAHNDALDMATQLRAVGFEVILKENLGKEDMENAIADFTRKLKNYGVALFYFAGHGFMSTQKENYLMSVEMRENLTEAFAKDKSISMETLMASMDEAKSPTKLLFVDACSNNPFRSWGRSDQKGLGSVSPPEGMVAFFAASPGQEASENPGKRNGLFTQELLNELHQPNLELTELIRNTRNQVKALATDQSPYRVGDLSDVFYFQKTEVKQVAENKPTTKKYLDLPFAEMAFIKGGTFMMGDTRNEGNSNEKPVHQVTVSDFWMGKFEVTVAQFNAFIEDTGYITDVEKSGESILWYSTSNSITFKQENGISWKYDTKGRKRNSSEYNHPVLYVSWNDATAFCEWLSKKEKKRYRLPTEAEWEYVAGGGTENRTRFGNDKDVLNIKDANFDNTDRKFKNEYTNNFIEKFSVKGKNQNKTIEVGFFSPNHLGIYDLTGNVFEWCEDSADSFMGEPYFSPIKEPTFRKINRGGCWCFSSWDCRVSYRRNETQSNGSNILGFRIVSAL